MTKTLRFFILFISVALRVCIWRTFLYGLWECGFKCRKPGCITISVSYPDEGFAGLDFFPSNSNELAWFTEGAHAACGCCNDAIILGAYLLVKLIPKAPVHYSTSEKGRVHVFQVLLHNVLRCLAGVSFAVFIVLAVSPNGPSLMSASLTV